MSTPSPAAGKEAPARLPGGLDTNRRLSQWLRFTPAGTVEVSSGKVEIGQGILTAIAQIAADELDVDLSRVRMVRANTASSPNEAITAGSQSVQDSGIAVRFACAEARAIYLAAAAQRLGVAVESLTVQDGTISGAHNLHTSYWELADKALLEREATASVAPKPSSARRVAGMSAPRTDIPDKVFGRPRFIQDLALPDMLHGRILRPPSPGARLSALDDSSARSLSGVVAVVHNGDFVGVAAETEFAALEALGRLRKAATWRQPSGLPEEGSLHDWMRRQPVESNTVAERDAPAKADVARTVRRSYSRPYLAHASIGPSCAIAQWTGPGVRVWSHSQGIFNLRADLAIAVSMPPEAIVVEHVEGSGCYGHNGSDDAAFDAVLLARSAGGRPVKVQWSREDELAWSPAGAAMAIDLETDLDAKGEIVAWRCDIWSNGHTTRPGRAKTPTLLAASHLSPPAAQVLPVNPPFAGGGGAERNAVPLYDFPSLRVANHRLLVMPVRVSSLRSLGAFANVFAIESMIDEIACEKGEDPLAFRLRHLTDPRSRNVLEAAARRAGWQRRQKQEGVGYGIGFARYKNAGAYCAAIAEVEAGREVRVRRLVAAVDAGEVISPDGVVNQIEGGAIQATSWTLKEAVRFDHTRITSDSWESYPILRFSEVPAVEVEVVSRPNEKPLGAGEASQGPTAAAIANALHDALGIRVRDLPLTAERIVAAMS
jgi:CO/xanthine dehydrogenase Mo-binding subunit